jgi:hypothetical protein
MARHKLSAKSMRFCRVSCHVSYGTRQSSKHTTLRSFEEPVSTDVIFTVYSFSFARNMPRQEV